MIYDRRPATLTDKDTIVLAEFANTTGDPVFDGTLRQGLAAQLQQSPFFSIVSDDRIGRTLAMMQQSADTRLTPEIAQGVCVRTASAAVLDGSIGSLGSQYVLGLRATSCSTGDILADEQVQVARKEEVLGALSQMTNGVRERLGESVVTIEKYSRPFQEATTASLDAWKAFTNGRQVYFSSGRAQAEPLFQRAIAIDPDFAIAHAQLGIFYSNVGESALSRQSTIKAYESRHRATDAERFFIETVYDRQVTGNMDREMQTLEAWAQTFPRDPTPHGLMAGFATRSTGKYEQSIAAADRSSALDPEGGSALSHASKAYSELYLNRLDAAEATIRRAEERNLNEDFSVIRYFIAFVRGDGEGLTQQAALARANRATEDLISHLEALRLAGSAQLQDARQASALAVAIAQQSGRLERAALFEAATAVWEALYENPTAAKQKVTAALALGRGHEVDYAAAFALAVSGDVPQSRALADDLAGEYPEDTSVQFLYLPTLRALFALDAGDAAAAVQSLQAASRFDLATGGIGFNGYFGKLYPIYVRGLAYLAAQQPAEAAAEFQRIVDHRSIVLVDPIDALARLQLARALALAGDTVKARSVYDDLLVRWVTPTPTSHSSTKQGRNVRARNDMGECMQHHSRWPTVAVVFVFQFASGAWNPRMASRRRPRQTARHERPVGAAHDRQPIDARYSVPARQCGFLCAGRRPGGAGPRSMPSSSPNPLTGLYGGWQAVENSALALAESADLLLIEGRMCSNGEVVNVGDADWTRFVDDYRDKSVAAYEAALTKNQDAMVDASGSLSESCLACHRVYRRESTRGDPTDRCIPGPPAAPR